MISLRKRSHPVINKPCGAAPHDDISAFETQPKRAVGTPFPAPQKYGRQTERNGDNRGPGIILVAVLMQAEFGSSDITIDQAGVRIVLGKAGLRSGACCEAEERGRHGRPGDSTFWVNGIVTVTRSVGYPT